jgi:hypothetical protein
LIVLLSELILFLLEPALLVLLIMAQLLEFLFPLLYIMQVLLLNLFEVLFFVLFKLLLPFDEYLLQQVCLLFHLKPLHSYLLLLGFFTLCPLLVVGM